MPSQRALSGFSGTPPGTTVPARSPAQARVRDAPGGIDRLVLDVVEPGGRLEADLADGDPIGLDRLELLVERELEARAVDDHDRRVLLGQLRGRDLGLDDLDFRAHGLGVADVEQPLAHLALELRGQQPPAVLRGLRGDVAVLEVDGRVDRRLVDVLARRA